MGTPLRVLIVEDSEDDTELLMRELRRNGYDLVFERVDTPEAMNATLDKQSWDIVIADHAMPNFSAPAALTLLQNRGLDLPFIIVSGAISEDVAVAAMKAGAHDYIMKDNLTRLIPAIERELREAEERRERKRAEQALRAREASFRNVITGNADGIIIIDRKGVIHFVNPAAEALLDRKAEEFIDELFGFPVVAGETMELDIIRRDQDVRVAEMRVVETEWEGKSAYLASLRDITERKRAEEELQQSFERLQRSMESTVHAIALMVEMRDPYTAGHQRRVSQLACAIAREMSVSHEQIEGIRITGLIHDVGKISVPAAILNKPGQLSESEFDIIKAHPQIGYDILKAIEFPWPVAQIVLQHHERIDGSGYPSGLSDGEILLEAKILGVADVVEAMSSHRPYRPALGIDKALKEIAQKRDVRYDPKVVDACLRLFTQKEFEFA
ncbi:MAG: HD domain-containing phosphohydrolase [Candidatus Bipolaricaulia bacterium]